MPPENDTYCTAVCGSVAFNMKLVRPLGTTGTLLFVQVRLFELGSFSCRLLDGHTDTVLALDVAPDG